MVTFYRLSRDLATALRNFHLQSRLCVSLRAAQRAAKQSHRHIGDCARKAHLYRFVRPRVIARPLPAVIARPLPAVIASRPEGGEAISPSHRRLRAWGLRPYSPRVRLRPFVIARPIFGLSNPTVTSEIARAVRGYPFVRLSLRAAQRAAKQSHRHIGDCARSPRVRLRPFVIASRPEGGEAISPTQRTKHRDPCIPLTPRQERGSLDLATFARVSGPALSATSSQ